MLQQLEYWIRKVIRETRDLEFDTHLIGVRTKKEDYPKAIFNKTLSEAVKRKYGSRFDPKDPDVQIICDIDKDEIEFYIKPVFIYGRYRKLIRGIPQTRWDCKECGGKGCEKCNFTGKMYPESVEELIGEKVKEYFKAKEIILHGCGREDVDARMLGNGRPFVLEIRKAWKRRVDLNKLTEDINKSAKGKIEVLFLRYTERHAVRLIKTVRPKKVYLCTIKFEEPVEKSKLQIALDELKGKEIVQRTPIRVMHRRANLKRIRKVYDCKLIEFSDSTAKIEFTCESGMYVKEMVSGDFGRTRPSLSEILGTQCEVTELDVIGVEKIPLEEFGFI